MESLPGRRLRFGYLTLDSSQTGEQCQPGLRKDFPVIAGRDQVNNPAATDLGHLPGLLADHSKATHRKTQGGQSVRKVRVGTAVPYDDLRLELLDQRLDNRLEHEAVGLISGMDRQGNVDGETFSRSGAYLMGEASSRV